MSSQSLRLTENDIDIIVDLVMIEAAFPIATYGVLLLWLLIAFWPQHKVTKVAVHSAAVPMALGLIYFALYISGNFTGPQPTQNSSLMDTLRGAFQRPDVLLAGWIHFLCFDLFVGSWIARDAAGRSMRRLAIFPCLVLTYVAGPVGLMIYLLIRKLSGRGGWLLWENGSATQV